MARTYGRIPRGSRKDTPPVEPTEIRLVIAQNYTWEQFALDIQRGLHRAQEYGATGLTRFRAQFMPLDADGKPMTLYDEHGQPVTVIHVPELPAEKPYRANEPGVGSGAASSPRQSPNAPEQTAAAAGSSPEAMPPRPR